MSVKRHQGNVLAEYGLSLALIAVVSIGALGQMALAVGNVLGEGNNLIASNDTGLSGGSTGTPEGSEGVSGGTPTGDGGTPGGDTTDSHTPGGSSNQSYYEQLANYSPEQLGQLVEVGGVEGSIDTLVGRIEELAKKLEEEQSQESQSLYMLAEKGRALSQGIKEIKDTVMSSSDDPYEVYQNILGADFAQSQNDLSTTKTAQLMTKIEQFNQMAASVQQDLLQRTDVANTVGTLSGDISKISTEFRNHSQELQEVMGYSAAMGQSQQSDEVYYTEFLNGQNPQDYMSNVKYSIADAVVKQKSDQIALAGQQ